MPQFEISTFSSQLFWFFTCWGILFIYLWKFLVPRMTAKLSDREHKIKSILAEASNFESQTVNMLSKYEDELNRFKQVQKARLQQVTAFIQKSKEDLEGDLKKDLHAAVDKLEEKLKKSQQKLLQEVPIQLESVLTEFAKQQLPFKLDNESTIHEMLKQEIKKLDHHD
jgi:F-type H+-transporting ATPase subunit b